MKRIRIGNDIHVIWEITRDGKPEEFTNKKISVRLLSDKNEEQHIEYNIKRNIIHITFLGKDQTYIGGYILMLIENDGLPMMSTLDVIDAFKLVSHSSNKTDYQGECQGLTVESLQLTSNFEFKSIIPVVDNLDSNSISSALSANQGRVLNIKIQDVKNTIPSKVSELQNDSSYTQKGYVDNKYDNLEKNILIERKKNGDQDEQIKLVINELSTFVKKIEGYGLSQEDFNTELKNKLLGLKNYDDTIIKDEILSLQNQIDSLIGTSLSEAIDNFKEIENFLQGFTDKQSLTSIIHDLENDIVNKIPTDTSQLNNDSFFVVDENYIHTDNNYDAKSKSKVDSIDLLLNNKVDKIVGYSLMSDSEITRLSNIENYDDTKVLEGINEKQNKTKVVNHGVSNTTFTLPPNEYHIWGEVTSLNITQGLSSEAFNIYAFEFKSGNTPTNLLVKDVKFTTEVDIEPNKTYQVTILNGIAAIGGA